ncbi:MAG TPA: sigma-70 family RNA polymerase sigma factor [Polyangiaceae bacterium]
MAHHAPVAKWPAHELAHPLAEETRAQAPSLSFDEIYATWYDEVSRWVRALGGPVAERDDLVQDVFIVVHRRLADFDGANLPGWLYQIARRRVRDFRRLLWVKHLITRRSPLPEGLVLVGPSPVEALETKEKRILLEGLLQKLNESERAALILFEVEGYSGQQIAAIQAVPINTVWARIHKARRKLQQNLERAEQRETREADT